MLTSSFVVLLLLGSVSFPRTKPFAPAPKVRILNLLCDYLFHLCLIKGRPSSSLLPRRQSQHPNGSRFCPIRAENELFLQHDRKRLPYSLNCVVGMPCHFLRITFSCPPEDVHFFGVFRFSSLTHHEHAFSTNDPQVSILLQEEDPHVWLR